MRYKKSVPTGTVAPPAVAGGTIDGFGHWSLDEDGLLTIHGKGKMPDWKMDSDSMTCNTPWYQVRNAIKRVHIPDSVTSIGDWAFMDCCSLTSIHIPGSVTHIGWCAFWGCGSLTSIDIPNSVTRIMWFAFWRCSNLRRVTMPARFREIGYALILLYGINWEIITFI